MNRMAVFFFACERERGLIHMQIDSVMHVICVMLRASESLYDFDLPYLPPARLRT